MPAADAAAGYVLLLRDMLVTERGNTLHLCACVPDAWLAKPVAVERAPTRFGPAGFRVTRAADGGKLIVEVTMPTRRAPEAVVVHLPVGAAAVKAARADPGKAAVDGRTVRVTGWEKAGRLEIDLASPKSP